MRGDGGVGCGGLGGGGRWGGVLGLGWDRGGLSETSRVRCGVISWICFSLEGGEVEVVRCGYGWVIPACRPVNEIRSLLTLA